MGVERLLALWQECGGEAERIVPDCMWSMPGKRLSGRAFRVAEALRGTGFSVTPPLRGRGSSPR